MRKEPTQPSLSPESTCQEQETYPPLVRTRWTAIRVQTHPRGVSRTKQSFADDCDVNSIVRRWKATGVLDHVMNEAPRYGDFSTQTDYQEALTRINAAQANFERLPAELREVHGNDPGEFIKWAHDPEKREELEAAGLGEFANYLHGPKEPPSTPSSEAQADQPEKPPAEPAGTKSDPPSLV